MEDKKIIVEQNGSSKEISKEKLEEIQKSPEFLVTPVSENEKEKKVNVKTRLYD